jgi:hypothetical protein
LVKKPREYLPPSPEEELYFVYTIYGRCFIKYSWQKILSSNNSLYRIRGYVPKVEYTLRIPVMIGLLKIRTLAKKI